MELSCRTFPIFLGESGEQTERVGLEIVSRMPFRCDSFPFVGATLVVALPLQATEIGRGPRRESHAISRRPTGAGSVSTEEGTHKGCPYGIRIRG